jgi:hypothetical protein
MNCEAGCTRAAEHLHLIGSPIDGQTRPNRGSDGSPSMGLEHDDGGAFVAEAGCDAATAGGMAWCPSSADGVADGQTRLPGVVVGQACWLALSCGTAVATEKYEGSGTCRCEGFGTRNSGCGCCCGPDTDILVSCGLW